MRSASRHLILLLAALLLAGCQNRGAADAEGRTPERALRDSIDLLRTGDLAGLSRQALPPADLADLRADWRQLGQGRPPPSADEPAGLQQIVCQLAGPDAATTLYAELQPKLAAAQQKYEDQQPILASIAVAWVKRGLAQDPALGATRQAQVDSMLDVLLPWLQTAPWFDQARAKKALAVAVATARRLPLQGPDRWRAMDFDTAMAAGPTAFSGIRQVLAIYGLSLDATLGSARVSRLSGDADHALVRVDYSLLGKPLSIDTTMLRQGGHWYSKDLLERMRATHRRLQQAAAATKDRTGSR